MITNFDHVHIYCRDLEASLDFYQGTLGAEALGEIPSSSGGSNHFLLLAGQFLRLSHYPPGIAPADPPAVGDGALTCGFGVAHLGLNVTSLASIIARLRASGVHVHGEPRGGGPIRFVYFTAPDGVIIELTEYVLPARLRPVGAALNLFNRAVHASRRTIGKALIKAAA